MLEAEGAKNYDYEFIIGTFNQSSAKETCANKGKKLIEIQNSDQLLILLRKLNGKYVIAPSGTRFQVNISNFIFESNRKPFREGPITTAILGREL